MMTPSDTPSDSAHKMARGEFANDVALAKAHLIGDVWLVTGHSGMWEDRQVWLVCYFLREQLAVDYSQRVTARLRKWDVRKHKLVAQALNTLTRSHLLNRDNYESLQWEQEKRVCDNFFAEYKLHHKASPSEVILSKLGALDSSHTDIELRVSKVGPGFLP